jgi:6-phosphogluconolactonase
MAQPVRLALPAHIVQHGFEDDAALAAALAERVAEALRAALRARSRATLVVSGGRSPRAFLGALARQALDWPRVSVTLADERWLPAAHADSNAGMVRAALLREAAASADFVPLYGGEATPEAGAAACIARLARLPRPFDAVVLGMGEDGHTASLFPGSAALPGLLADSAPPAAAVQPPNAPHARMSLSLPALLDARTVFIQIGGGGKRAVIEAAAQADPLQMPIAAVLRQRRTPVEVFYDASR